MAAQVITNSINPLNNETQQLDEETRRAEQARTDEIALRQATEDQAMQKQERLRQTNKINAETLQPETTPQDQTSQIAALIQAMNLQT